MRRLPTGPRPSPRLEDLQFRTMVMVSCWTGIYHLPTPSRNAGGGRVMIRSNRRARQPVRDVWSREWLVHERAIALGNVIDRSTLSNYSSALNSYLNFVKLHDFPVELTPETLSFFTVYMSHHINPCSVNTYLSGISQQLEAHFPNVKEAWNSTLVRRTLQGCMRMRGVATICKCALTINNLQLVINHYHDSTLHDDLLFVAMIITGFFGLLRLGEMAFPDDVSLQN